MKSVKARLNRLENRNGSLEDMIERHRQALEWLHNLDGEDDENHVFISVTVDEAKASFEQFWKEWREVGLPVPPRLWGPNVADMMSLWTAQDLGPEHSPGSVVAGNPRYK